MDDDDDDNFIHEDNFIMMKLYAADKWHAELIGVLELQLLHSVMLPLQLVFRCHCLFATFDVSRDFSTTPIKPMDSVTQQ